MLKKNNNNNNNNLKKTFFLTKITRSKKNFFLHHYMLLLVSKTRTVDSPNSQHLEILGFNRIDFSCFTNKEIQSVFHGAKICFLHFYSFIEKYYDRYYDVNKRYKEQIFQLLKII